MEEYREHREDRDDARDDPRDVVGDAAHELVCEPGELLLTELELDVPEYSSCTRHVKRRL